MIFDADSQVRPRDLGSRESNRRQGQQIATQISQRAVGRRSRKQGPRQAMQQQRDEMAARLLFYNELSLVAKALIGCKDLLDTVHECIAWVREELKHNQQDAELSTVLGDIEQHTAALRQFLMDSRCTVYDLNKVLHNVRNEQMNIAGFDVAWRYAEATHLPDMAAVGKLSQQVESLAQAVTDTVNTAAKAWDDLEDVGRRRHAFFHSERSVTLRAIDTFTWQRFEQFTASLVEDEGCVMKRIAGGKGDRGIDVIGTSAEGLSIGLQCKYSADPGNKVGCPEIRLLNGDAKLVHKVDVAVAVSNQGFTKDAIEFAAEHGIHLIGREELRRWATWGDPLMSVLGLPALPERPASTRAAKPPTETGLTAAP